MPYYESESEEEPVDPTGDFGENSMANIFGRPAQPCKPFKNLSDVDLNDPRRTIKVALKSILIANLKLRADQVAEEYWKMYGTPLLATRHGYHTVDEMLTDFTDICSRYEDQNGIVTYIPITDERHEDLQQLIRRQVSEPTARRTGRLPCSNGPLHNSPPKPKPADVPPKSDIRFRAPWLKDRVASTKVIGQFPCEPVSNRIVFNDEGPHCAARCRAIANMVREIGEKSPDNRETRCPIETLKNHYWQHTGLSIWGKIMTVPQYAEAWRQPKWHEFWRIMREEKRHDEEEDLYYIVVRTNPEENYFHLLPPDQRPVNKQPEQPREEIRFDNNLCSRSRLVNPKSQEGNDYPKPKSQPYPGQDTFMDSQLQRSESYHRTSHYPQNCSYDRTMGSQNSLLRKAENYPPRVSHNSFQLQQDGSYQQENSQSGEFSQLQKSESYLRSSQNPQTYSYDKKMNYSSSREAENYQPPAPHNSYQLPQQNQGCQLGTPRNRELDTSRISRPNQRGDYQQVRQNNQMPEYRADYGFRPQFTSSANSTLEGSNFFGCRNIDLPPPDISNISAECSVDLSSDGNLIWGKPRQKASIYNEVSCREVSFAEEKKDYSALSSVFQSDLSSSYREKIPSDNESSGNSKKDIVLTENNSLASTDSDPLLEQLSQDLGKCHLSRKDDQVTIVDNPQRPRKKLAANGVRLVNYYLQSHMRDRRRRDPTKPCNSLPLDREDLKARQLASVPFEREPESPVKSLSSTSLASLSSVSLPPEDPKNPAASVSSPIVSLSSGSLPPEPPTLSASLQSLFAPPPVKNDTFETASKTSIASPENRLIRFAEDDDVYTISDISSIKSADFENLSLETEDEAEYNDTEIDESLETSESDSSMITYDIVEKQCIQEEKHEDIPESDEEISELALSSAKITELANMLIHQVNQIPSSDGRMSTLHCMMAFGHMLQNSTGLELRKMINNIELVIKGEQTRNSVESEA